MKNGKCKQLILVMSAIAFAQNVSAADIRDQMEVLTGKAELVVPDMPASKATELIKDALSQWSIPANANLRSMPSTIPARPDEPTSEEKYYNGAPAVSYKCPTAYAEITKRPPAVNNAFAKVAEGLQACVYPFQKGTKVYLLFTRLKRTESLTAGLFNGITRAIQGTDAERIGKQLKESIESIQKNIPTLLVEKLEVPGADLQEPDKERVATLIPAKTDPAPPIATTQAVPANTAPTSMQTKIEARKNLSGMGLNYFSQEQFVAAIRRKDDVAVQLFLDAGGLDLTAKEKGKSFVVIAEETGASDIAKMIAKKASAPEVSATATPSPATAPTPSTVIAAKLSPEDQANVDKAMQQLPSNLTPEQREAYRAKMIQTIVSLRSLTNRIDPETGALR